MMYMYGTSLFLKSVTVANNKMHSEMSMAQAVTKEQIKELTREVRAHNDFATRIPLLEQKAESLELRVGALEEYHKQRP